MSKVRTRAQTSLADPCKRRRLLEHVSLTLVSELPEETSISGIMDFFVKLRILAVTWAVAGSTTVHWRSYPPTSRAWWKECLRCVASTMKLHYWRTCVCVWSKKTSARVQSNWHAHRVSQCHEVLQFLQAAHDDASRWDQRRDFLSSSSSARLSPAQLAAVKKELGLAQEKEKGKGKGKREREPTQLAPPASTTKVPLQLGSLSSGKGWQSYKTVDKIGKKFVCRAFNDGRGCSKWCQQSREHRCDVKMASGEICGARKHARSSHDKAPRCTGILELTSFFFSFARGGCLSCPPEFVF